MKSFAIMQQPVLLEDLCRIPSRKNHAFPGRGFMSPMLTRWTSSALGRFVGHPLI